MKRVATAAARRAHRPLVAIGIVVGALVTWTIMATAWWGHAGAGTAQARADVVPTGPTPAVTVSGRSVTLNWPAVTMADGAAVTAYTVERYNATGTAVGVTGTCTGTVTARTCKEVAVAPGQWQWAVRAVYASWTGPYGTRTTATVGAPSLTISTPSPVTALPATLNGTIANFVDASSLTFRLDNATSGPVLAGSPSSVPAGGSSPVTVTLPAGTTQGAHTVFAVGSGGDVASAPITVTFGPPVPSLVTANGGSTAGRPEANDVIAVTFSQKLDPRTICSSWADNGTTQTLATGVIGFIQNNSGATGNDVFGLYVPGCAGTFRFGSIDLGSSAYVSGLTLFGLGGASSVVTYDPVASKLTIILGSASTQAGLVGSSTAVYTPEPGITSSNDVAVSGTATYSGVQF